MAGSPSAYRLPAAKGGFAFPFHDENAGPIAKIGPRSSSELLSMSAYPPAANGDTIHNLLSILDLEPLEINLFRGRSGTPGGGRVFGGQVVAQALAAALRTVEPERVAHSLHGYFMLGGDPTVPIIYDVDRIRDGRSFTTRRVNAIQHGKAIFSLSASFQVVEDGLEHQVKMPDVPMPEDLPSDEAWRDKLLARFPSAAGRDWMALRPLEVKPLFMGPGPESRLAGLGSSLWLRTRGPLPDALPIHQAVLAYASDLSLLQSSLVPHKKSVFDEDMQVASLDHALWFHKPFRADDWLLYSQESPLAYGTRGFCRGQIFTRDGVLVASAAQEGLIRPVTPR